MKKKLIFLHGAIGSKNQFNNLKPLLADHFDSIALNFPGHGTEKMPATNFSIELFVDSISPYIEASLKPITLVGYSLGGYVALLLAAKYPEKIEAVFTFATIFEWNEEQAQKQIKLINADKIEEKVPLFAQQLASTHGDKWKEVLENTQHLLMHLGNKPNINNEKLVEITQPVYISVGDRDHLVSIDESVKTYRHLENGKLAVFPNTGHAITELNMHYLSELILSATAKDFEN